MTSPADIYESAERPALPNVQIPRFGSKDETREAANAKSFEAIEAEANEDARRIVRGQTDATSRAMDCLKQGFRDSLSPFSEEEAQRIDAAMLADKKRNRYDSRREEQAAQVEANQRRARGEA